MKYQIGFKKIQMTLKKFISRKIWNTNDKLFEFWEKLGFHITPRHFYQPIPDTRTLNDDLWRKQSELIGIDMNEEYQLNLLSQFSSKFKEEYDNLPKHRTSNPFQYFLTNTSFNPADGKFYYSMIRYFKPSKIIEIGAGFSTLLAAQAIRKNEESYNTQCELIAIEPYPRSFLKIGFPSLTRLIQKKVQEVPLSFFNNLNENDILFIDSSHILTIGSDVYYEFLEILPRLKKGVIIHFHDIFLPAEYSKKVILKDHHFFNEQYLLQAFLAFNDSYKILWAGSYMYLNYEKKLDKELRLFKGGRKYPKSFWIQKVK